MEHRCQRDDRVGHLIRVGGHLNDSGDLLLGGFFESGFLVELSTTGHNGFNSNQELRHGFELEFQLFSVKMGKKNVTFGRKKGEKKKKDSKGVRWKWCGGRMAVQA